MGNTKGSSLKVSSAGLQNYQTRMKEQKEGKTIGSILQDTEGCRVKRGWRHHVSPHVNSPFHKTRVRKGSRMQTQTSLYLLALKTR